MRAWNKKFAGRITPTGKKENHRFARKHEPESGIRCTSCFDMRFERTALYAHEAGFDIISSSLGISRWKDFRQVTDAGVRAARRYPDLIYWEYNWRKVGGASR